MERRGLPTKVGLLLWLDLLPLLPLLCVLAILYLAADKEHGCSKGTPHSI